MTSYSFQSDQLLSPKSILYKEYVRTPPAYKSDIQVVRSTTPQPPQQWSLALNVTRTLPGDNLVNHPRNINSYAVSQEETPGFDTDILWDPNSFTSRVGRGYNVKGPGLYAAVGYGIEDVADYDADTKK